MKKVDPKLQTPLLGNLCDPHMRNLVSSKLVYKVPLQCIRIAATWNNIT